MKKKLMTIAIALFAISGISVTAANRSKDEQKTEQTCCKDNKEDKGCKKGEKACPKQGKCDRPCCAGKEKPQNPALIGITLTDEQKQKVESLEQSLRNKMDKVREDAEKAGKKAQESYDSDLKKLLTSDQLKQYEENKEKCQSQPIRKDGPRGMMKKGPRPERMSTPREFPKDGQCPEGFGAPDGPDGPTPDGCPMHSDCTPEK
jgi:Spy/CpxP family protein refolding chaperone